MNKLWQKVLLIGSAIAAGAFFIFRIFFVKKEITHEDFPQQEKKRLEGEKKELEQDLSQSKQYSDEEIQKKFNR